MNASLVFKKKSKKKKKKRNEYKLSHNFSKLKSDFDYIFSADCPLPGIENNLILIHLFFLLSCILIFCSWSSWIYRMKDTSHKL